MTRGFAAPCPHCGTADGITVYLDNLATFNCPQCGDDFTADDVRAFIARWQRVLDWIDQAPVKED